DKRPAIPLHESVIYEVHVKGFSKLWRELPEELRGTYAGLGSPPVIDYFQKLSVTAVELLPVHAHIEDKLLVDRGLTNYRGHNTSGLLAPHGEYSSSGKMGQQVAEFKAMVRSLHGAGIEVTSTWFTIIPGKEITSGRRYVFVGSTISPTTGFVRRIRASI